MHQQPPIRFVHPDRSNRRGHENRKHCNREHKLSARQTETQRTDPDRRLYGCFRQDRRSHRTAALFYSAASPAYTRTRLLHETGAQSRSSKAHSHQRLLYTGYRPPRRPTQTARLPLPTRACRIFSDRRFETSGTHFAFNMHAMLTTAKSPDTETIPFQPRFHCHQKKRQTEHQDHLHAVSDAVGTGICRVNYPLSKANGLPASQTSFLRSTPVGAEQTSTGCFAPYYLHRR